MSLYSRLDRLAADHDRLERKFNALANSPQAQRTSIEAGTMDVNDEDGNLISTIGFQEDGSGATRFFDGPIPPVPAGFTALADGPLIQGTWDGTFQDGAPATYDLAYLEFAATLVEDSGAVSFATINAKEGASATVVANQTGQWAVAVRSVSQAGKKSEFFSAGTVEVKVTDLSGAIEAVQDSANGKNKITWSLRPPTADEPGIVGDTWWVNEFRTRENGDEYLAIIAQYQYQADGWVQVEMAHEVIASVDLGTATVGELDGILIKAETISGRSLEADALNFKAARGLLLESPVIRVGNAVEITEDYGIRQFGPDGALNISLPSDGSPASFAGDVRAKSLTATGRMAIEGPAVVASGGQMQLESGVTPPATPPNVSSYVKRTQFPPLSETENAVGLAFDGTYFWRAVDNSVTGAQDRMERIDAAGNLVSSFDHYFWVRNGITVIGDEIFALGIEEDDLRDKSKRFIYVYDFAGTLKRRWEYAAYGSGTYQPAIGTDGTYVFVAQCWATGEVSWRKYDKTTGAGQARYDATAKINRDVIAFSIGTFDFEASTAILTGAVDSGATNVFNPTTGEAAESAGWFAGDKEEVRGTVWANGRFHHLSTSGNLITMSTTKYPNGAPGPETNDWWAVYTWSDGVNETTISAPRQFTWSRRSGIKLSPGDMPAGVTSVRVYVAREPSEPIDTDYGLVPVSAEGGSLIVQDFATLGAAPPVSNSFPNSTPGIVRSALGNIEFRGDGSGRMGPLVFHADGTMSSTAVPAWIPVTTFATGYGPQTWGFTPAYRIWPDEKVEWRGVVRVSGTPPEANDMRLGTADVFTVPFAARPAQAVNCPAASTSGTNLRRVEFSSAGSPTMFRVYHSQSGGAWVSLEGIYYYKS